MSKSHLITKRARRKARKQQMKINARFKNKLCKGLFCAPCYYCHFVFMIDDLTIEHLTPLILGGTNDESNIALACAPCNHSRGREAWFLKRQQRKNFYEQHSAQHQE